MGLENLDKGVRRRPPLTKGIDMDYMNEAQRERLIANHKTNSVNGGAVDLMPVIKLFAGSNATWLLTEFDPDRLTFFGLCDLGSGFPELGYVDLASLGIINAERDLYFVADKTIGGYATQARKEQRIVA